MTDIVWTGSVDNDWGTPGNWQGGVVPVGAGNRAIIPAGSPAIDGTDETAAGTLDEVVFEAGYTSAVGVAGTYLQIPCLKLTFSGTGVAYIDLETECTNIDVLNCASGTESAPGLSLKGSEVTDLDIGGVGVVAFGMDADDSTSEFATAHVRGNATLYIGRNVTDKGGTYTNDVNVHDSAKLYTLAPLDDLIVYNGGSAWFREGAYWDGLTLYNGKVYVDSTGEALIFNVASIESKGALFVRSAEAKTFTSVTAFNGCAISDPKKSGTWPAISFPSGTGNCKLDFGVGGTLDPA